jgi:phage gp16-like protein
MTSQTNYPGKKPAIAARNNHLAQIHIGKKELGMDDDTYRSMLFMIGRVHSSKDLDYYGRIAVLNHMKARGFKNKGPTKSKSKCPLADDKQSKMIRGLWLELHGLCKVKDASEAALNAYVKRITTVEALQWLTTQQASKVIETLKKWIDRHE